MQEQSDSLPGAPAFPFCHALQGCSVIGNASLSEFYIHLQLLFFTGVLGQSHLLLEFPESTLVVLKPEAAQAID